MRRQFTNEQICLIRFLYYKDHISLYRLAEYFRVSRASIRAIVQKRTCSDVR